MLHHFACCRFGRQLETVSDVLVIIVLIESVTFEVDVERDLVSERPGTDRAFEEHTFGATSQMPDSGLRNTSLVRQTQCSSPPGVQELGVHDSSYFPPF